MAKLFDGKNMVEVEIREYDEAAHLWGPDWSNDFYGNGGCEWDEEHESWKTDDVDYSIEYANDWMLGIGDFQDDADVPGFDPANRTVNVIDDSRWYEAAEDDDI